jgi:hypothetical protein
MCNETTFYSNKYLKTISHVMAYNKELFIFHFVLDIIDTLRMSTQT